MKSQALATHRVAVHRRRRGAVAPLLDRVVHLYLALPVGVAIALVWANTMPEPYFVFAHSLAFPVNEIGMALFVGLIMQEIVEAVMPGGALHSWRRWSLPLLAAAGGMAGSAGLYLAYVHGHYESILETGWPIASAIDIAAAYYVLKTILPRSGALPFVLLLAIATNLAGMFIIAPQYPVAAVHGGGLGVMLVALGIAGAMRALLVRSFWPYLVVCGTLSWVALYREGLHPAFALVPIVPFLPHEPRRLDLLADPPDDDAVHHFEHEWNTLVQVVLLFFRARQRWRVASRLRHRHMGVVAGCAGWPPARDSDGGRRGGRGWLASATRTRVAPARRGRVRIVQRIYLRTLFCDRHSVDGPAACAADDWRRRHRRRFVTGHWRGAAVRVGRFAR
jgi:hypothetical protein